MPSARARTSSAEDQDSYIEGNYGNVNVADDGDQSGTLDASTNDSFNTADSFNSAFDATDASTNDSYNTYDSDNYDLDATDASSTTEVTDASDDDYTYNDNSASDDDYEDIDAGVRRAGAAEASTPAWGPDLSQPAHRQGSPGHRAGAPARPATARRVRSRRDHPAPPPGPLPRPPGDEGDPRCRLARGVIPCIHQASRSGRGNHRQELNNEHSRCTPRPLPRGRRYGRSLRLPRGAGREPPGVPRVHARGVRPAAARAGRGPAGGVRASSPPTGPPSSTMRWPTRSPRCPRTPRTAELMEHYATVINISHSIEEAGDTIYIDQSVNQNIEAYGDVNQSFDQAAVTGDGAVLAGDDSQVNTGEGAVQAGGDVDDSTRGHRRRRRLGDGRQRGLDRGRRQRRHQRLRGRLGRLRRGRRHQHRGRERQPGRRHAS